MDEEIRALYLPGTFRDRTRLKLRRRKEGEGKLDERSVSEVRERETEIITRRYFNSKHFCFNVILSTHRYKYLDIY